MNMFNETSPVEANGRQVVLAHVAGESKLNRHLVSMSGWRKLTRTGAEKYD